LEGRRSWLTSLTAKVCKNLWSPIYAFFLGDIEIRHKNSITYHVFKCVAHGCKYKYTRNLSSKDKVSSKMLHNHAKKCWGEDTVRAALDLQDLDKARNVLDKASKKRNGNLMVAFSKVKKVAKKVFSHTPMTNAEMQ